ncbi:hypothetical protein GCM10023238_29530 [Streptomyces heliomycini]
MSRPRQGTEETVTGIVSAAVRAFYEKHVRSATATVVVVGDRYHRIDLDALLAHPGRLHRLPPGRGRPTWSRRPAAAS